MKRGLSAAVFLLLVAACRTTAPAPFPGLSSSTPEQAWAQLVQQRGSFGGARAYARVTTRDRSFRATMEINRDGSFQVHALSPIGTTVATIQARDREVTVEQGRERSTRSLDELGGLLGLPRGDWTARDLSLLLVGLPPNDTLEYDVTETGLRRVVHGAVEIRYDPPVFPPQRVTFQSGEERFELEYLELQRL